MKSLSLLFGELKPWQHETLESAIFVFFLHFPRFQNRVLVVVSVLSQHVAKSLNTPGFIVRTELLQLFAELW